MRSTFVVTAVALGLASSVALASERGAQSVPVMVGGEADLDACGATGIVSGLRGGSGSFLAVRTGPGLSFKQVGRLQLHTRVWICESRQGWLGVVYGPEGTDCGVSSPVATRKDYTGPCASGWVAERFVRSEAG